MTPEFVIQILREALMTAFWLSAPLLAVGFIAGIVMSLVQILTSIQDSAFNAIPLVQGNHQQLPFPLGVNLGGLRNGVLDSLLFLGRQLRQILRAELLLFPRFLRRFLGALLHGLFDLRTDWRRQRLSEARQATAAEAVEARQATAATA